MSRVFPSRLFALSLVVAGTLIPTPALACGGFFCMNQPMDQAGERILFIQDGGEVKAHVKIAYQGEAKQFSWVVPTPTEPTLEVGSDALFRTIDQATRPEFNLALKNLGDCHEPPAMRYREENRFGADKSVSDSVQVVSRAQVGPYDSAVIRSDDANALRAWLKANGYDLPAKLDPLLDPYVAGKYYFVALKLQQDRGAGDLQPIVMKYKATKPGIPIRLTGIAATNDMDVFVWVLGDARAIPENYRHATINEARIDWLNAGSNYRQVVTEAMNEAGGQAFVTDYAGDTKNVDLASFRGDRMDTGRLARLTDPVAFLRAIQTDGYFEPGSAAALAFVRRYVPIPKSMKDVWEPGFYSNPEEYRTRLAKAGVRVEAAKAARELEETVVAPYREIMQQFGRHHYMTRLYTTLSPEEMTQDPLFRYTNVMPDVSNVHEATGERDCRYVKEWSQAPIRITLKNGLQFTVHENKFPYPEDDQSNSRTTEPAVVPAALRIEQLKAGGNASLIRDNYAEVSEALDTRLQDDPDMNGGRAGFGCSQKSQVPATTGAGEGATFGLGLLGVWGFWRLKRRRDDR